MSHNSIIEHRGNYFYIEFREEYLAVCLKCSYKKPETGKVKSKASPYCKALILAILESWTNDKRGKSEDLAIYMTYPQWIDAMYGMFGRCVIIDSLDELLGEGLISREKHKMYGKDTYKYRFNYQDLNRRIKLLPEKDPKQTRPKIDASTNRRQNSNVPSISRRESRLLVDDDASTNRRNIESTNLPNIESNEGMNADDSTVPNVSLSSTPSLSSLSDDDLLAELHKRKLERLSTESTPVVRTPSKSSSQEEVPPTATQRKTEELDPVRLAGMLTPEELRIHSYWLALGFEADITPTLKSHWGKLTKHIQSQDEMNSLFKYTRRSIEQCAAKDKTVYPGNLVKCVTGWKQEKMPSSKQEASPSKSPTSISGLRNYSFEPEIPAAENTQAKAKLPLPEFKLRRMNKPSSVVGYKERKRYGTC